MECVHTAILTVIADLPPIVQQLVGLPGWCIFLSVPSLAMYPEDHPYARQFALPDDVVSLKNVVVFNASLIASLPYDTAKQYASRSFPDLVSNNNFSSTTSDHTENETSNRSQDQQAMSSRAVAHDTSALITVHNIAYLLAIHQGSQDILEVWPDVQVDSALNVTQFITLSNETRIPLAHDSHLWFNPHPHFGPHNMYTMQSRAHSWPRGFPLRQMWDDAVSSTGMPLDISEGNSTSVPVVEDKDVGIITALVDVNPDVDTTLTVATDQLPLVFRHRSNVDIALPLGRFAPISSACTLWRSSAFPLLFLPPHAPVRMIDVFRGLFAQRAMHASGQHIVYRAPIGARLYSVMKPRMDSKDIAYDSQMTAALDDLLPYLHSWAPQDNSTLAQYSLDLLKTLSHSNMIGSQDVSAAAEWLDDLRRVMSSEKAFTIPLDEAGLQEARQTNIFNYRATRDSAIHRGPKIAVCIAGDIEVLQKQLEFGNLSAIESGEKSSMSPYARTQNLTAGHALWQNLIMRLPSPDFFVVADDNDVPLHSKANDSISACDFLVPQYPAATTCTQWASEGNESDWSVRVRKQLLTTSKKFYESRPELRLRHACKSAIEQATPGGSRSGYDWVMYVDTGTLVESLPGLESLILDQRDADGGVVWTSSQDDLTKRNNSQPYASHICSALKQNGSNSTDAGMFVGHWKQMSKWLNALELVVVAHNTADNGTGPLAEEPISDVLAHNGVTVKAHPMIVTCPLSN